MTEREEARIEPVLREMLLSEPDIVAWLEPNEGEGEDDERQRAS